MNKRMVFNISVVMMCIGVAFSSCKHQKTEHESMPLEVNVQVIDTVNSGHVTTYIGEVEEGASVAMNFAAGGTLKKLMVREGDKVKKGQLLAVADNQNALNAYRAAKASLKQAEDGCQRLKKLYDQGSIAEVKWIEMQTNLEKASSMEQLAKKQLDECCIYAPFSGIVGQCNVDVGETMLPHETVMTILDTKQVYVVFAVPENDVEEVEEGDKVMVQISGLSDPMRVGVVTERSITPQRLAHSYKMKVMMANSDSRLLPGMVSKVFLDKQSVTGFVIPAKSVQIRPEGKSIWIVKNGRAVRRSIASTEFVSNGILVMEGLQQGDSVIVGGIQNLYDNAAVKVR